MNNKDQCFENDEHQNDELSPGAETKEHLILSQVLGDTPRHHDSRAVPRPSPVPNVHSSKQAEEKEVDDVKPSVSSPIASYPMSKDTRSAFHVSFVERNQETELLSPSNGVLDHTCVINGSDYSSEEDGVLLSSTVRVSDKVAVNTRGERGGSGAYRDRQSPQCDVSIGADEYYDGMTDDVIDMEAIMNGRNSNRLIVDSKAEELSESAKMQTTDANGNITADDVTLNGESGEKVDEEKGQCDEVDGDVFRLDPCTSMSRPSTQTGLIRRSMSDFLVGSSRVCSGLELRPSTSTNPAMAYIDSESETPESWEREVLYSAGCETTGSLDSMQSTTADSSGEATDTESALDDEVHHLTKEMALSALAGDPDTNSPSYFYSRSAQLWVDKCDRNKCVPNEEIDECYEASLAELFTFSVCDLECVIVGLPVTVRLKVTSSCDQNLLEEDDLQVKAYNRAEIFIERWEIDVSKGQQYIVIYILPLLIETCYLLISSFGGRFRSQKVGFRVEGNNPLMSFTEGRDWPIALAADPPAGAVVVVYPHHIVHFSDEGEFIRELLRDPDAYFNDIAVHREEQLIAVSLSDWVEQMGQTVRNQGLRLYDVQGRLLWEKNDNPEFMLVPVLHMTFDSNANVIVAAKDCICKCSRKSGSFQVQIPLANFGTASRLAVSQERHVLLLDGATCHVHMLNEDLCLLAVIQLDFTSCAMSISNGWSGLAVDRHGFVFVTNCVDNAIMIYTQDGQKAGFIESEWDDVRWPLDIAASADGHVFVVDHRHACIKKFCYQQLIRTWKARHKLPWNGKHTEEIVD